MLDSVETIGLDLEEARAKIDAVREKLRRSLDAQEGDQEAARRSLAWLERLSADVARVEGVVTGRVEGARGLNGEVADSNDHSPRSAVLSPEHGGEPDSLSSGDSTDEQVSSQRDGHRRRRGSHPRRQSRAEYQSSTRRARSVFQRLGSPAPSSMSKWTSPA
jgi:hypothetical protein